MATVTFDQATRMYRDGDRPAVERLDLEIQGFLGDPSMVRSVLHGVCARVPE